MTRYIICALLLLIINCDIFSQTEKNMPDEEWQQEMSLVMAAKQRWSKKADSIFSMKSSGRTTSGYLPLSWPMRVDSEYDFQHSYFYRGKFFDQNPSEGPYSDHNCGDRASDNHFATDISIYPFWWSMMDKEYVSVVASAPGIIIERYDTIYDRRCLGDTFRGSNRIWLLHEDGSTTHYHHLKQFGVTSKDSGDYVERGEFLGYVASSGNSAHPHLHFVVVDSSNNLVDPFFEDPSCNNTATQSWWINQQPYWYPKINRVMTHSTRPRLGECEEEEDVFAKNHFQPGDSLHVGIGFAETQFSGNAYITIIKPNLDSLVRDTIGLYNFINMVFSQPGKNRYQYYPYVLPTGNTGTWTIKVEFEDKYYYHFFTVGCTTALNPAGTVTGTKGYIAGSTISSTVEHQTVNGDKILYQAPSSIEFKPGFHAPAGVLMKARLKPCNYAE